MWPRRKQSRNSAFPTSNSGFSEQTVQTLRSAGWTPDRAIDFGEAERALTAAGFTLSDKARAFLARFAFLELEPPIDAAPGMRGFVDLDPRNALRFFNSEDHKRLVKLIKHPCCLVGSASGHTMFLFIDETGAMFVVDWEWRVMGLLAADPFAALETLCDGRNGRVPGIEISEDGSPGVVYEPGRDRQHWRLDLLPDVAGFFPETSLEPACRPPDGLAVAHAVQRSISEGNVPVQEFGRLFISSGGHTVVDGRIYFVSPTENGRAFRHRAPFQVAGAPSDQETRPFRPGEVVFVMTCEEFEREEKSRA